MVILKYLVNSFAMRPYELESAAHQQKLMLDQAIMYRTLLYFVSFGLVWTFRKGPIYKERKC